MTSVFDGLTLHATFVSSAAVLIGCYLSLTLLRILVLSPLRHIPGPFWARFTSWPLAIEGINGRRIYKLEELHRQYGNVVRVGPREVSVADWRHIRTIYCNSKTVMKHAAFYSAASFVRKNNIFQMTDPMEHAARRKLSSRPYAQQSVTRLDYLIQKKGEDLAHRLISEAATTTKNTADAYKLCGLFSFETICKAAFAKDFDRNDGDDAALSVLRAMEGSAPTMIFDSIFPFLRSTGLGPKIPGFIGDAYRNLGYWEKQSRSMVDHFLEKSSSDDQYLLTPIATGVDSFLDRKLNHEELVEEAMGYMFAGSGTTSSTLTYLLYALSLPENWHIQERLRREINELRTDDISGIRQHPYLNAVIKETFRRYPTIVSTLPRVLLEPLHLHELVLPKGTVVGMQNWMHHRDAAVFPNPDAFQPERWLRSSDMMEDSLTPFSIGRRNCIGQNLAWEELYLAVGAIMHAGLKFSISPEMEPWEMEIEDRFNIAPRGHRLLLTVTR
ncbi:cytochrome P450 [Pyrenochaeta sp. DS3sAY3a]|nr:cytochrome P450 [Pyrenochaeta sp. DS3sAY3a]